MFPSCFQHGVQVQQGWLAKHGMCMTFQINLQHCCNCLYRHTMLCSAHCRAVRRTCMWPAAAVQHMCHSPLRQICSCCLASAPTCVTCSTSCCITLCSQICVRPYALPIASCKWQFAIANRRAWSPNITINGSYLTAVGLGPIGWPLTLLAREEQLASLVEHLEHMDYHMLSTSLSSRTE